MYEPYQYAYPYATIKWTFTFLRLRVEKKKKVAPLRDFLQFVSLRNLKVHFMYAFSFLPTLLLDEEWESK